METILGQPHLARMIASYVHDVGTDPRSMAMLNRDTRRSVYASRIKRHSDCAANLMEALLTMKGAVKVGGRSGDYFEYEPRGRFVYFHAPYVWSIEDIHAAFPYLEMTMLPSVYDGVAHFKVPESQVFYAFSLLIDEVFRRNTPSNIRIWNSPEAVYTLSEACKPQFLGRWRGEELFQVKSRAFAGIRASAGRSLPKTPRSPETRSRRGSAARRRS